MRSKGARWGFRRSLTQLSLLLRFALLRWVVRLLSFFPLAKTIESCSPFFPGVFFIRSLFLPKTYVCMYMCVPFQEVDDGAVHGSTQRGRRSLLGRPSSPRERPTTKTRTSERATDVFVELSRIPLYCKRSRLRSVALRKKSYLACLPRIKVSFFCLLRASFRFMQ